ncbi:MAG: Cof-type HAD-IIB family hydrolase [Candidatus Poribacteria bacterium]|nr:Cof-type HAD-IIB family hydrolase [Candidatus Poribacteria bacterium]
MGAFKEMALRYPPLDRRIEMVAADMDGTLLNEHFQLDAETVAAARSLQQNGIRLALASGRAKESLLPFHRQLNLQTPLIAYNGALVWDPISGETLSHTPVPLAEAEEVVRFAEAEGLHWHRFHNERFYAPTRNDWLRLYERRTGLVGETESPPPDEPPTKIILICEPPRPLRLVRELRQQFGGRLYIANTMPEYVEFMHPRAQKGRALRTLARRLNIRTENILAFGDAQNDETMFDAAGMSIAMGDAPDELKAKADLTAPTNREQGVARALQALGLA